METNPFRQQPILSSTQAKPFENNESPLAHFQRKSLKEKKVDNQLWLALDRYKNIKAEENEAKDLKRVKDRNQQFLNGISH